MSVYTVKQGDTLEKIAKAELRDASRAMEIARGNGLEEPYAITPGMKLRLPDEDVPPTLRMGTRGPTVQKLQEALQAAGIEVKADGAFGKNTDAAVRSFQRRNDVRPVDGVAGPATWRALLQKAGGAPAAPSESTPQPTQYTTQPGDTLRSIAAKVLGDGDRWPELVEANNDMLAAGITPETEFMVSLPLRLPQGAQLGRRPAARAPVKPGWIVFGLLFAFVLTLRSKPKEATTS